MGAAPTTLRPRQPPPAITAAAPRVGLVALAFASLLLCAARGVPGCVCLSRTLRAAAVIACGGCLGRNVVGAAPMVFVGRRSYSFYLWHFPVLILPSVWLARPLRLCEGLLCLAIAFVLAGLTYAVVEQPIRHSVWL